MSVALGTHLLHKHRRISVVPALMGKASGVAVGASGSLHGGSGWAGWEARVRGGHPPPLRTCRQHSGGHIHLSCLGWFPLTEGPGPSSCPQSMASQRDPLPTTPHPVFPTTGWKRQVGMRGAQRELSQSRQHEGPADPPTTSHAMGSPPHISPVIPLPPQQDGPHQFWEGSFLSPGMSSALGTAGPCPSGGDAHW